MDSNHISNVVHTCHLPLDVEEPLCVLLLDGLLRLAADLVGALGHRAQVHQVGRPVRLPVVQEVVEVVGEPDAEVLELALAHLFEERDLAVKFVQ